MIPRCLVATLFTMLCVVEAYAADLSIAYSQSSDPVQGIIVSYFNRNPNGNSLIGTLQLENISDTWVYIEQDVTSNPNPALLPNTIYLLGPGAIKQFPNFTFSQGSYLKLTATTPLGLDFASSSEKRTALEGALSVDLMTRGLLSFALPADIFDGAVGAIIDPLLEQVFSTVGGGYVDLELALVHQNFSDVLKATLKIASETTDLEAPLAAVLSKYITADQVHYGFQHAETLFEILDLPEKIRLLTELTAATFIAPPTTWSRLDVVGGAHGSVIASVSPNVLTTLPLPQTQTLTITGTGFTPETRFVFRVGTSTFSSKPERLTYDSPTQMRYKIAVGSAIGTWTATLAEGTGSATFQVGRGSSGIYTITPSAGPHGSITPNTGLSKATGESQTFIAVPQDSAYTVGTWYLDGSRIANVGNRYTLANIQSAHTLFVTFAAVASPTSSGSLSVRLSAQGGGIPAGAQWRVDGDANYHNSDEPSISLTPGLHTISFKAVAGYITPPNQPVTIVANAQTPASGVYTPVTATTYTLNINTDVSKGSVYRNPNRNTFSPGETVRLTANYEPGWHFDHWSGDASGSGSYVDVVMNSDKTVTANWASGDGSLVTITVTIDPPEAATAGARWRVDGSAWQTTGQSLTGRYLGSHYLEFSDITGWTRPVSYNGDFVRGATNLTATYTQILQPTYLQVVIRPQEAVTAGAQWRADGGDWQNGGATIPVSPGANRLVEFKPVTGWAAPGSQTVGVVNGQTRVVNGSYSPPPGVPLITSVSPGVGPLAGGTLLNIVGANFAAPAAVSIGGQSASNVTVLSSTQIT